MIDIIKLLKEHNIPFRLEGRNVARENVNITCPFCANTTDPDMDFHLGIKLDNGYFACWRDLSHRGKNINRLLKKLGIRIESIYSDKSELEALASGVYKKPIQQATKYTLHTVKLPESFVPIEKGNALDRPFLSYLKSRGFPDPSHVASLFDLRRCIDYDKWHNRLIIPLPIKDEYSWTGRFIGDLGYFPNTPRYLSPSIEAKNVKDIIADYNNLYTTRDKWTTLVIAEGPLDWLKFSYYAPSHIRCTCIFGISISPEQISLIKQLYTSDKKVFVALDNSAIGNSLSVAKKLNFCNPQVSILPIKDFGDMNEKEIQEYVCQLMK